MLHANNVEIERRQEGDVVILEMKGEINLFNCPDIKEIFDELIGKQCYKIVINLKNVTFIDSSGLGAFISGHSSLKKNQSALRLACVPNNVMKTFELTNLNSFFGIFETEEAAVNSFPS